MTEPRNNPKRTSRPSRDQRRKRSQVAEEPAEKITHDDSKLPYVQRVFLYIQLNDIEFLPNTPYPLELHLYHSKNTLRKMSENYTTETIIYQNEFNLMKPTFTLTVIQDDIEDMNIFSDNPLMITLYQRVPRILRGTRYEAQIEQPTQNSETMEFDGGTSKDDTVKLGDAVYIELDVPLAEEESVQMEGEHDVYDEEHLEFMSRGTCDLLQVFQRKRFISDVEVYLYPDFTLWEKHGNNLFSSTLTKWHMYTVLPILKLNTFNNLAFITLESLYNVNTEIIPKADDVTVNLSFRSTVPDEQGNYDKVPICSFLGMCQHIISEQHTSIVWENIKRDLHPTKRHCFTQIQSNFCIKLPKLFNSLLCTENVDLRITEINPVVDTSFINNSMHRYVLNNEMRSLLEYIVVHNTYQLYMEVSREEQPDEVLYDGVVNLSIFAYPDVQSIRFAVALRQVSGIGNIQTGTTNSARESNSVAKPTFAILKVCLYQKLMEKNEPLDYYNISPNMKYKLQQCSAMEWNDPNENKAIIQELYRSFDDQITDIMRHVVKCNLKTVDESQEYFCCQLANLHNVVLKICGCDFNVRIPTTTNIEFREMLTHMYKELMDRIYTIIMTPGRMTLCQPLGNFDREQLKMINLIESYKYMIELNDTKHAELVRQILKEKDTNKVLIRFFVFVHDIEKLEWACARTYLKRNKKNREWNGYYFSCLAEIYINYMIDLNKPSTENVAVERLFDALRRFSDENLLEKDAFILLYCLFKQKNYIPGMEYTRWRFENLDDILRLTLENIPTSLYEIYLKFDPELKDARSIKFYKVFKIFVRMGLFGFAETVFNELRSNFSDIEMYLMSTVLKMLQQQIDEKFKVRDIKINTKDERGQLLHHFLIHINGNAEYARNKFEEAVEYFKLLLTIEDQDLRALFRLSYMRLGKYAYEQGDFDLAQKAYERCERLEDVPGKAFIVNFELGRTLYKLGRLEAAITYFAKSTECELHDPDVWGYLATINMRLGRNKYALECWKMAKLQPEVPICDDVYNELSKIKPGDVNLIVE